MNIFYQATKKNYRSSKNLIIRCIVALTGVGDSVLLPRCHHLAGEDLHLFTTL